MGDFVVLRTTSVSPLDRDKDTLSLTRKNAGAFFRFILTGRIGESEDDGVFEQTEFYFDLTSGNDCDHRDSGGGASAGVEFRPGKRAGDSVHV